MSFYPCGTRCVSPGGVSRINRGERRISLRRKALLMICLRKILTVLSCLDPPCLCYSPKTTSWSFLSSSHCLAFTRKGFGCFIFFVECPPLGQLFIRQFTWYFLRAFSVNFICLKLALLLSQEIKVRIFNLIFFRIFMQSLLLVLAEYFF